MRLPSESHQSRSEEHTLLSDRAIQLEKPSRPDALPTEAEDKK